MKRSVTFDPGDVVVVPFPFVDRRGTKRRPALVLSDPSFNEAGATILAMITTEAHRPRPGDTELLGSKTAGLHASCIVRLKLFTLDNRLIVRKIGKLDPVDEESVSAALRRHLPWAHAQAPSLLSPPDRR
ncbi:MAG: type II toxin-antitoxin system PemK/MazF family toxin [Acidobacteriota bacterium]